MLQWAYNESAKLKLEQGVNHMRTYRLARFVAVLLFLAALIYFCGGAAVGLYLWNRGLGAGWGSGFTGWISIPIFIATFFGALTLLMFGVLLYFLAIINTNLTKARQGGVFVEPKPQATPAEAAAAELPIVPPAPSPAPAEPIVVIPPVVETVGQVEAPTVVVEPPQVEIAEPQLEIGPLAAPSPDLPTLVISAPQAEIEPLATDAAASISAAAAPPDLIAELPEADADADVAPQEFAGRLPGAEQAARIASELAAAKGTDQPDA